MLPMENCVGAHLSKINPFTKSWGGDLVYNLHKSLLKYTDHQCVSIFDIGNRAHWSYLTKLYIFPVYPQVPHK